MKAEPAWLGALRHAAKVQPTTEYREAYRWGRRWVRRNRTRQARRTDFGARLYGRWTLRIHA